MARELFRRGLLDRSRALIAWCVGVARYILFLAAVFPSLRAPPTSNQLVEKLSRRAEGAVRPLGRHRSDERRRLLRRRAVLLMLPLFVLVLAIGSGARTSPARRRPDGSSSSSRTRSGGGTACSRRAPRSPSSSPCSRRRWPRRCCSSTRSSTSGFPCRGWPVRPRARRARRSSTAGSRLPSPASPRASALATAVPAALAAAGYLIAGLHDLAGWLDPLRYVSAFWWVGRGSAARGRLCLRPARRRRRGGSGARRRRLPDRATRPEDAVARPGDLAAAGANRTRGRLQASLRHRLRPENLGA